MAAVLVSFWIRPSLPPPFLVSVCLSVLPATLIILSLPVNAIVAMLVTPAIEVVPG
jgi:hypothetical protein